MVQSGNVDTGTSGVRIARTSAHQSASDALGGGGGIVNSCRGDQTAFTTHVRTLVVRIIGQGSASDTSLSGQLLGPVVALSCITVGYLNKTREALGAVSGTGLLLSLGETETSERLVFASIGANVGGAPDPPVESSMEEAVGLDANKFLGLHSETE